MEIDKKIDNLFFLERCKYDLDNYLTKGLYYLNTLEDNYLDNIIHVPSLHVSEQLYSLLVLYEDIESYLGSSNNKVIQILTTYNTNNFYLDKIYTRRNSTNKFTEWSNI